jgi:hypothetical protein
MHLFITEIPAEARFSEALAAFEPFGPIRSLTFLSTKDGSHSGCAFLSFHDPGSGVKCPAQSRPLRAPSSFFDFPPAHASFRDHMVGMGQVRSSVFFQFLRPSLSPSLILQGCPILFDLPRPSMTFGFAQFVSLSSSSFVNRLSLFLIDFDCLRPSSSFCRPSSRFCDLQ